MAHIGRRTAPDDKSPYLAERVRLATVAPPARRRQLAAERRFRRAGRNGEREAADLLEGQFQAARTTAIRHERRVDVNGRVAQIDHLLLHRTLHLFVREPPHVTAGLTITEAGAFLRGNAYPKAWDGMPSPRAPEERHLAVRTEACERLAMPTPLGLRPTPVVLSDILVAPRARIDRPKPCDPGRVRTAAMVSVEADCRARYVLREPTGQGQAPEFPSGRPPMRLTSARPDGMVSWKHRCSANT